MNSFDLPSESEMLALARSWGPLFRPGAVVFLSGDLGAGKTTLVRGFLGGLGYEGAVKSPTYTLVESYVFDKITVFHFDLYRIKDIDELEMIGMRDMMGNDSICFIEWPDRGDGFLPTPDFAIDIEHEGTGRKITLTENAAYSVVA